MEFSELKKLSNNELQIERKKLEDEYEVIKNRIVGLISKLEDIEKSYKDIDRVFSERKNVID